MTGDALPYGDGAHSMPTFPVSDLPEWDWAVMVEASVFEHSTHPI